MRNRFSGWQLPIVSLAVLLALPAAGAEQRPGACRSTVTGDLRVHRLSSRRLGNTRMIRMLLSAGYEAPANVAKRYPFLYLLDGQNLFDACLSELSHREWQIDETVGRLIAEGRIPPMIVVGVDHVGRDRTPRARYESARRDAAAHVLRLRRARGGRSEGR